MDGDGGKPGKFFEEIIVLKFALKKLNLSTKTISRIRSGYFISTTGNATTTTRLGRSIVGRRIQHGATLKEGKAGEEKGKFQRT